MSVRDIICHQYGGQMNTEAETKEANRIRKIKQRAPGQIEGMVATVKKLRQIVDYEVISEQLVALASACSANPTVKEVVVSEDKKYQYDLSYIWDESIPYAMFIGLNPPSSTVTAHSQTIKRCIQYAKSWGCGGVHICNVFAWITSDSDDLLKVDDPVGQDNDKWLSELAMNAGIIVAAWGNKATYGNRAEIVQRFLPNLHSLTVNKSGEPGQLYYLSKGVEPVPYKRDII